MAIKLRGVCDRLGNCTLVKEFGKNVTHIVADADENRIAKRTLKYCCGVMQGIWVVSFEWIKKSDEANIWVPENPFEILGDSYGQGAAERSRRLRERDGEPSKLFEGYKFMFYGKTGASHPSPAQLTELIKVGGGTVVSRPPAVHNDMFIILCDPTVVTDLTALMQKHSSVDILSLSYILDSISSYEVLADRDLYRP